MSEGVRELLVLMAEREVWEKKRREAQDDWEWVECGQKIRELQGKALALAERLVAAEQEKL